MVTMEKFNKTYIDMKQQAQFDFKNLDSQWEAHKARKDDYFINRDTEFKKRDTIFLEYVMRRAFFVLGRRYRSYKLLKFIARNAIINLHYNYKLPINKRKVDKSIIESFVYINPKILVRSCGWFGPNRKKDRFINKFLGE